MELHSTTAIVIGGSMAGLLAARALSDHFDRVTVIERDQLPDEPAYRSGVPQARHLHGLMVRGQRTLDKFFPGFTQDLVEAGAPPVVWGLAGFFFTTGGATQRFDTGITSNIVARVELEYLVRRRVSAIPNVHFLIEADVGGLLTNTDKSVVTGVRIESRADHTIQELFADLVVDASGRSSKTPEWLTELGYSAPDETVIDAHCGYSSRWYEIPDNPTFSDYLIAVQPRTKEKLYRGAGLLRVDAKRWVVTLIGGNRDYPPTEEAAFMEFAKSLPSPAIYDAIKDAKPITPIYGYRRLENRRRHYERLSRRPENFIVMGDAACAFNPIYGQGMTTAAIQAEMLSELLKGYSPKGLNGFADNFQKRLFRLTKNPWLLSITEDLRYPDVEGAKPDLMTRFSQRYFDLVAMAMAQDNTVAKAFYEAMNMLTPPTAMMRPAILLRVLRYHFFGKKPTPESIKMATGEWSVVKP
jgi:2-polyprenyl-6-methoxyphenol hydroxylase-like FAD-dependent oxidoreductase